MARARAHKRFGNLYQRLRDRARKSIEYTCRRLGLPVPAWDDYANHGDVTVSSWQLVGLVDGVDPASGQTYRITPEGKVSLVGEGEPLVGPADVFRARSRLTMGPGDEDESLTAATDRAVLGTGSEADKRLARAMGYRIPEEPS